MARTGSFDLSGMKELQKSLEKLQKTSNDFVEDCSKELAARLLRLVIERTPVGQPPQDIKKNKKTTVEVVGASGKKRKFLSREAEIYQQHWAGYMGGTLRRGWISATQEEAESKKSAPQVTEILEYINGIQIARSGSVFKIEIVNPVEYVSYVEYGHRQEPGRYVPALGKRLKKGWAKGKFMMTVSERELRAMAPKILEKRIKEFLGGIMQ